MPAVTILCRVLLNLNILKVVLYLRYRMCMSVEIQKYVCVRVCAYLFLCFSITKASTYIVLTIYLLSISPVLTHPSDGEITMEIRKYFELIMKTQHGETYGALFSLCFPISYCWALKNVLVSVHLF